MRVNRGPKVHCKMCDKDFSRIDWLKNKDCDNPNCSCPEVKRAMRAANDAIKKAQDTSRNEISINEYEIPDNYDEDLGRNQLMVDCLPVMVINITPSKRK